MQCGDLMVVDPATRSPKLSEARCGTGEPVALTVRQNGLRLKDTRAQPGGLANRLFAVQWPSARVGRV